MELLHLNVLKYSKILNLNVCREATVKNCASYETYNKCAVCISGYYLDKDKLCQKYPEPIIQNCLTYSYWSGNKWEYQCIKCASGMYVKSEKFCQPVTTVLNCITYNTTSANTGCLECASGFYVSANQCVERVNKSVANC